MDKIIVITGAGGGLGSVFAKELAKDGFRMVILDSNLVAAEKVASAIKEDGGIALAVQCDVTSKESLEHAREVVRFTFGKCNILLNCAGIQDPLAKTTREMYQKGDELNTIVSKMSSNPRDRRQEYADLWSSA